MEDIEKRLEKLTAIRNPCAGHGVQAEPQRETLGLAHTHTHTHTQTACTAAVGKALSKTRKPESWSQVLEPSLPPTASDAFRREVRDRRDRAIHPLPPTLGWPRLDL